METLVYVTSLISSLYLQTTFFSKVALLSHLSILAFAFKTDYDLLLRNVIYMQLPTF